jgi:hypothetical protein
MGTHREGERNTEGERLLDMRNKNYWAIGNGWSQKKKSHKITCYSWDSKFRTIIDYFIMTRNLWNIFNAVKIIPSIGLEADHRILIADLEE